MKRGDVECGGATAMMTSGIYSALGLVLVAIVFAALSSVRGTRFAYLAVSWLPLAALILAVGAHHHLGYAMIGVLMAILVACVGLVFLGVYLCAKAMRERAAIYSLIAGILIAALPLLILLARW
jgi:hypothetical protein